MVFNPSCTFNFISSKLSATFLLTLYAKKIIKIIVNINNTITNVYVV